jgi:two-component system phosphate regulon sensor histidine kinase PhoR
MLKIVKRMVFSQAQDYLCMEMSRKFLWIIAIFMGFAMIALIIVQTYWINNAYRIKEKQFSQLVNRALYNVVSELQEREAVWHIMEETQPLDTSWQEEMAYFEQYNLDINATIGPDGQLDQSVYFSQRSNQDQHKSELTIIADDSILRIKQNPGLVYVDTGQEDNIHLYQSQNIRRTIEKKMAEDRIFIDRIMKRMIRPNAPIEKRIDPAQLDNVIKRQFQNSGIDVGYEFAILRENMEPAFESSNYYHDDETEYFVTALFPQDIFSRTGYLSLYFPRKASFLLKSLGFMGTSSIILTLVIILSFSVTIFIIFRQKRLSEIKNDFVSNMTHELKTPISTISLASQMLNDESIPAESKNYGNISRIIGDESKRLGYQVEKVLQMAIFDQGRIKLKKKKTDINELIHNVITNFTLQIENKNGAIKEDYSAENAVLHVDNVHFTNMISNLVDNAIKYSREEPAISVSTLNRNEKLIIRVKDSGIGIKKEDQRRIFEKFYRVPTGNIHNVKGFGLGLSYVKKIAEEHHGFLKLKSEPGMGTEFEISFPVNSK